VPLEGRAAIGKRLRAAERRHGSTGHRFAYFKGTGSLGAPDPTLASAIIGAAKTLADRAKLPVKIIAIDSLPWALGGEDENSAAVATTALNHVERMIAETRASVVLIAHPGKDKERGVRGSSALLTAISTDRGWSVRHGHPLSGVTDGTGLCLPARHPRVNWSCGRWEAGDDKGSSVYRVFGVISQPTTYG
jgi:hypothetical protein